LWQAAPPIGPLDCTSQHSSFKSQQLGPQQSFVPLQVWPLQGGLAHVPPLQNGGLLLQTMPQPPQLLKSLPKLTHIEPQQVKPLFLQSSAHPLVPPPVLVEPPAAPLPVAPTPFDVEPVVPPVSLVLLATDVLVVIVAPVDELLEDGGL